MLKHGIWKLDHSFIHPVAAAENAFKYFDISEKEYSLIRTHMWPFPAKVQRRVVYLPWR
jgi:hypothetical protein